jgi:hypothetical protein
MWEVASRISYQLSCVSKKLPLLDQACPTLCLLLPAVGCLPVAEFRKHGHYGCGVPAGQVMSRQCWALRWLCRRPVLQHNTAWRCWRLCVQLLEE